MKAAMSSVKEARQSICFTVHDISEMLLI